MRHWAATWFESNFRLTQRTCNDQTARGRRCYWVGGKSPGLLVGDGGTTNRRASRVLCCSRNAPMVPSSSEPDLPGVMRLHLDGVSRSVCSALMTSPSVTERFFR